MKLEFIQPKKELKPFISKIWLFENNTGLLDHGTLIAPNAKAKIIIPYINALTTTDHKKLPPAKKEMFVLLVPGMCQLLWVRRKEPQAQLVLN